MIAEVGSTADHIRFHADHEPGAVALIARGREFTYAQLHRDLWKMTDGVRVLGLSAGNSVAVACTDAYIYWLLLLAFENLGIVTGSFSRQEGELSAPLLAYVDCVMCDHDAEVPPRKKIFKITEAWLNDVLLSPGGDSDGNGRDVVGIALDKPMHIIRSSGTTGGLKMMIKTRRMYEARFQSVTSNIGTIPGTKHLFLYPFSINLVYVRAIACLRVGATILLDDSVSEEQAVIQYKPTHIHLLPLQLVKILDNLPADFARSRKVALRIGGAMLARSVQERALREIASDMTFWYGANEVDLMALIDIEGVGTLAPGVKLEVVDDDANPLPYGETGRIRAWSASIVDGYLNNPEATGRSFHDGWFYTGDIGVMEGARRIRVVGRYDELLNIGGLKISPDEIEDNLVKGGLLGAESIRELAVTSVVNPAGIEEICVALVGDKSPDVARVGDRIKACLPFYTGEIRTRVLDALPRTPSGKIRRSELRREFAVATPYKAD